MNYSRKSMTLPRLLCCFLVLPLFLGCAAGPGQVVTADPVVLEEESEDEG